MRLIILLIIGQALVAPLAAQDELPRRIEIAPAQVTIENYLDSIALAVTIEREQRDQAEIDRDEAAVRAMENIADYLENCGCVNTGPTTVNVLANAGLTLAAFLIAWQLKRIADKPEGDDVHTEGDTKVEVILTPEPEGDGSDDDHER